MKYLSLAIVPFIVGILTPLIYGLVRKSNIKKESKMNKWVFTMYNPLFFAWISIFYVGFLTIILVIMNLIEVRLWVNIIIIPMILLGIIAAFGCVRARIIVKNDAITLIPFLGKKKTFTFKEIKILKKTTWSNGMITYKVYSDKKLFSISDGLIGYRLFMQRIDDAKIEIEE